MSNQPQKKELKPYMFYKYKIVNKEETVVAYEHFNLFKSLLAVEVPHRKKDPDSTELDTSLVNLKKIKPNEENGMPEPFEVIYFKVAKHITYREKNNYDKVKDSLDTIVEPTDEYAYGELVVIPEKSLIAALDKSGLFLLGAVSSISRLRSIVSSKKEHAFIATPAGSTVRLKNAIKGWKINNFSFSARPFNPSVKKPGDKLHNLLEPDNVELNGKAKPWHGNSVSVSENGFITELIGLFDKGYAEIGLTGTTEHGYKASIKKNSPDQARTDQPIRVYIPEEKSFKKHLLAVVTALVDIDGKKE